VIDEQGSPELSSSTAGEPGLPARGFGFFPHVGRTRTARLLLRTEKKADRAPKLLQRPFHKPTRAFSVPGRSVDKGAFFKTKVPFGP